VVRKGPSLPVRSFVGALTVDVVFPRHVPIPVLLLSEDAKYSFQMRVIFPCWFNLAQDAFHGIFESFCAVVVVVIFPTDPFSPLVVPPA
jgi:hypothetical protein